MLSEKVQLDGSRAIQLSYIPGAGKIKKSNIKASFVQLGNKSDRSQIM